MILFYSLLLLDFIILSFIPGSFDLPAFVTLYKTLNNIKNKAREISLAFIFIYFLMPLFLSLLMYTEPLAQYIDYDAQKYILDFQM